TNRPTNRPQGKACPTDSGLEADEDRVNILKTSTLPSDSTPRVTFLAADEGSMQQKLDELMALCTSLQRDDAPIKGRRLDEGEEAAERVSDDTEEMATILTSMDAASILTSEGVQVVPTAAEVATATVSIPTGSGVVSTDSPTITTGSLIFTTATESTPYTRRKGKETMVESKTPKKKKVREQIDVQLARELESKALKGMTLEEIKEKFDPVWKQFQDFILTGSKEEAKRFNRKGLRLEQESVKKLKTSKEVKATEEVPEEKVKEMMQLVPVDEHFDKEDLNQLWGLVKETLSIRPATSDKQKELWVELKRLFEPDVEDYLWTHTQNLMHALVEWKLYDICEVHHVSTKEQEIFMLIEKDYPLRKGLAIVMISYKLQVEIYS
nr:hypothetical protein [Tanacetum cinerariifolium]